MLTLWDEREIELLSERVKSGTFHRLKTIKLKLTDYCNLRCPKCDYWKKDERDDISTESVKKVIEEGAELGLMEVGLSGGEPTLRKDLDEIVSYGVERGIDFRIISNGSYLNPDKLLSLVSRGLRKWTFSLDGHNAEVHDHSVGKANAFEKLIRSISTMTSEKQKDGNVGEVNVLTVVSRQNYQDLFHIVGLAYDLGVDSIRLFPYDFRQNSLNSSCTEGDLLLMTGREIRQFNSIIVPQIEQFVEKTGMKVYPDYNRHIFGSSDVEIERAELGDVALGFYENNTCFVPWHHLSIFPNGDVYLCCKKPFSPVGNIYQSSFSEMVHSERMDEIRLMFARKKHPRACDSCNSRTFENKYLGEKIE
jgi:radical SAM protein with 4Fe4S-binding SPASM domain